MSKFGFFGGGGGGTPTPPTEPIDNIQNVDVATTTALNANVYSNGTGGVGATLTALIDGAIPNIDGIAITLDTRILAKDEVSQIKNGVYEVVSLGAVDAPWQLVRIENYNETEEINNSAVFVIGGDIQAGFTYFQITQEPVVGTDNIIYEIQTPQAITVAKYTTSNTILVDRNSNFATNTRVPGDKYNRDKPFITLQAAINASAVGDTIEVLSNITENITIGEITLVLNNCTLDSLITGTGNVTIRGSGNCQLITDFTQSVSGAGRTLSLQYIPLVKSKTNALGASTNGLIIRARFCHFADNKPLLKGGFAVRPVMFSEFCTFQFDADYIFDNNNITIYGGYLINTKAGGNIKRSVLGANITTTQTFLGGCLLQSVGDNITGMSKSGGVAGSRVVMKHCVATSTSGKNISGSELVTVKFCELTANAAQAEHITVPAGAHIANFNDCNLAEVGANILNKNFNNTA